MIRDNSYSINSATAFPQRTIETLGRLQSQAASAVLSSVYIYDLVEQQTICASSSTATILGYTDNDIRVLGMTGLASLIHPEDLDRVSEYYQRFSSLLDGEIISLEYRMRRADGTWCRLRSQETPLVQAIDGFPLQILGVVQDVTRLAASYTKRPIWLARSHRSRRPIACTRLAARAQREARLPRVNEA